MKLKIQFSFPDQENQPDFETLLEYGRSLKELLENQKTGKFRFEVKIEVEGQFPTSNNYSSDPGENHAHPALQTLLAIMTNSTCPTFEAEVQGAGNVDSKDWIAGTLWSTNPEISGTRPTTTQTCPHPVPRPSPNPSTT